MPLRRAGVVTKLVTDHPHLFETGGENYHVDFTAWDYQRGHESDPWRTRPDPSWIGAPSFGRGHIAVRQLARLVPRRGRLPRAARDARGGALARARGARRTIASCCSSTSSIRTSRSTRPSRTRRCTTTTGPSPRTSIWPPYTVGAVEQGRDLRARRPPDPRAVRRQAHDDRRLVRPAARRARAHRTGSTTPRDRVHRPRPLPRREGHLGQARLPDLRAARPHAAARRVAGRRRRRTCDALTTNVDLHATLCDLFGVDRRAPHARPLARCRCSTATQTSVREWALVGHLGPRGAPDRRPRQVRPRAGGRQRAAVDVVEPLVDDAGARASRPPAAAPRRPRRARPHAGLDGAGDPPAVHRVRLPAVLGVHATSSARSRSTSRRPGRSTRIARAIRWAGDSTGSCTTRCSRSTHPTTSSCASATDRSGGDP